MLPSQVFNKTNLGEAEDKSDQGVTDPQSAEADFLPVEDQPMRQLEGVPEATEDEVEPERDGK